MPVPIPRRARLLLLCAALPLAACSTAVQQHDLTSLFKPYRIDVVQGNFVSTEMAAQLKPGMSREQVRAILGTPLLQDLFHADRWDYVFSLRQGYHAPLVRRFSVFFDKDGRMLRTQGDPLPSETAFVAQINALHGGASAKTLSAAQVQKETDAVIAKAPKTSASAAGPLTLVAPAAEIARLQAQDGPTP